MSPVAGRGKGAIASADIRAPAVTITAPGNGATITGAVNLTASATDIGSGVKSVQWQVDGSNYGPLQTASPFTQYFDPSPYLPGSHTITAIVTDNVNRTSSSSITINNQQQRTKEVTFPGNSGGVYDWTVFSFNTLNLDQWGNGFGDGAYFYIPAGYSGSYNLSFQVYQPGYNAWPASGYGSGWSGDASGQARIETSRYGNMNNQSWSTNDTTYNGFMSCFAGGVSLLAGDYIRCLTYGAATGIGVQNYHAHAIFTRTG